MCLMGIRDVFVVEEKGSYVSYGYKRRVAMFLWVEETNSNVSCG
jgi:hypothetical protein